MLASIVRAGEQSMKKSGTVSALVATVGQIKEILSLLAQAIPGNLSKKGAQEIISNKGKFIEEVNRVFREIIGVSGYEGLLAKWISFYKEVFDLEADFSDLNIPDTKDIFRWLLVMMAGLTPNMLFAKCKEWFPSSRYTDDLDKIESVRKTVKTYAIWLRDRVEADEENANKSAKDCDQKGILGITLEERLLLELFYHWLTGKHLDLESSTLCSGSSDSGVVPLVHCRHGNFEVYWCARHNSNERLCVRSVEA
jgi:hypothetical protein